MKHLLAVILLSSTACSGYTSLHQAQNHAHSLLQGQQVTFDAGAFKKLLEHVVRQHESIGYAGRYLVKLTPYSGTKFVIWGPLKGAFDSLVRTLTFAHEQGIIDENLTITSPETYMVFTGDVIKNEKTSLETLFLVLSLMKANPKKVFYLKGKIEDALHWQNNGLKLALKQKASVVSDEAIPLGTPLTRFFDSLPLALYITSLNPTEGSIRISYFSGDYDEIDEGTCGALLTSRTINVPQICYLSSPQKGFARVKALIKAEQRVMSYARHPGLTLVEPDKGAVAWSIFSGPSPYYQQEYDFYTDAFAILTMANSIKDATITLYSNDIRTPESLSFSGTFNLLTGIQQGTTPRTEAAVPAHQEIEQKLRTLYLSLEELLSETSQLSTALDNMSKPREQL